MEYIVRLIERKILKLSSLISCVVLEGVKFCGKTTLLARYAKTTYKMETNPLFRERISLQPKFILKGEKPILIDEWQLYPYVWDIVRNDIDDNFNVPNQFFLSGSNVTDDEEYNTIKRHDGAGRMATYTLRTLTLQEMGYSNKSVSIQDLLNKKVKLEPNVQEIGISYYAKIIVHGGWPLIFNKNEEDSIILMNNYILQNITPKLIKNTYEFNQKAMLKIMECLSRNIASLINISRISKEVVDLDCDIDDRTVKKYINILKSKYLIFTIPAWSPEIRSKIGIVEKSKIYFADPSLCVSILNLNSKRITEDLNIYGLLFESLVIKELIVYCDVNDFKLFYFRNSNGLEVDAIIEKNDGTWSAFEIKTGSELGIKSGIKNLLSFFDSLSENKQGKMKNLNIIVSNGTTYTDKTTGINIITLNDLFSDN